MKILTICVMLLLLIGCAATTNLHTGSFDIEASDGSNREALVYWTTTDRPYWFNTESGTIRLLTSCSTNTLQFDEQAEGIIFKRRQTDEPVGKDIPLDGECGKIENADIVRNVNDKLVISLSCKNKKNAFAITDTEYPKVQKENYEVDITVSELEDDIFPTLTCIKD